MEVIYIGGYGRSGSTLLDILLSNSPSVRGLGEASNLISKSLIQNYRV